MSVMSTQIQSLTCCESCGQDVDIAQRLCSACYDPGQTAISDHTGRRNLGDAQHFAESLEDVSTGASAPTLTCRSRFYIMTELIAQFSGEGPRKERAAHYYGLGYRQSLKESHRRQRLPKRTR